MDNKNNNIDMDLRQKRINSLKKRKIKRIIDIITVVSFCTIIFTISVLFIILKRSEVSKIENRSLAKMPSFSLEKYFSGEYTAGVEQYYNDTVPGREALKNWVSDLKNLFGIDSSEAKIHGIIINKDKNPEKQTTAASKILNTTQTSITSISTKKSETTTKKEKDPLDDPNIEGEISNNILVYNNRGIMLYGGNYSNGELYAQYVNNFKSDLNDVNVYSMVCPTPVSYYLPKKYSDMTASEEENINHINENLKNVTPIDALGALEKHKDEKIFENTDHHWAQLGAYYAAEEFAKKSGVPFADLNQYERVEKDGYVGTLYGYTGDSDLKDNPEKFIYYIPKCEYSSEFFTPDLSENWEGNLIVSLDNIDPVSWYCAFIGTDNVVTHVKTKVNNGRKLAVIKDSYGNALIPCLTSSFEDIYVIDMRYFEVNAISYIKEKGITDVLFAMNTFSATGSNFECIEKIRTQ